MRQQLFVFNADLINHMEVSGIEETVLLERGDQSQWSMEKPEQYPADRARIDRVLTELEFARRVATIELEQFENPQETLRQFGLAEPRVELKFRDDEHAYHLKIGNETARKGNYYAQIKATAKSEVIVVSQEIKSLIDTEMDSWRSKRIFDFDTTSVTAVRLKNGGADVELINEENQWMIARPYSGTTEPTTVISYLGGMLAARIDSFAPGGSVQLPEYGLNTPQVSLEIVIGDQSETLNIGNALESQNNLFYAQVSSKNAVFQLRSELVDQVKGLLQRVREKRILTQEMNEISSLEIQNNGSGWSVAKHAENWHFASDNKQAESETIQTFYTALSEVKGVDFFEKSDQNRDEFKLNSPEWSMLFTAVTNEVNDSEEKKNREIRISVAQDGFRYVESDYSEFLIKVPADSFPLFPPSRLSWSVRKLELPRADTWQSIAWDVGEATLKIARTGSGQWQNKWNGREIDQSFLKRQIDLLGKLEIIERVEVDPASVTDGLVLNIIADDQEFELQLSQPDNRFCVIVLNGDPEGYFVNEQDYQLLAVFPLAHSSRASE
ncbi:MAG: DUF4340 domain-containing protein [Verrucomicrobiota bacterium]